MERRHAACFVLFSMVAHGCASERSDSPVVTRPPDPPPPVESCPEEPDGSELRVFVVGHKHELEHAESYASFKEAYERQLEAVEDCILPEKDNLVVFPEGSGLVALSIGSRGEAARAAATSTDAFLAGVEAYQPLIDLWTERFPGISREESLFMATSDVVWRATLDTFGAIARSYDVWVIANVDIPEMVRTPAPYFVERVADPDLDRVPAVYVPLAGEVYNRALLFNPQGTLEGSVDKAFLTDSEEELLDLTNGDLTTVAPLETPFGDIAIATSRDAFYAPYLQRMEDLGADLVVQPEAWSGWTVQDPEGGWLPDVFVASGWHHTQKHGAFRYSLAPQLTGNFYEMLFDGQVHVAEKVVPDGVERAYVGQNPMRGWLAVGPWVAPDPGGADPSLDLDARRASLRAIGEALAPGSGDARENRYTEGVVIADLDLERDPIEVEPADGYPESAPIGGEGLQRLPEVVSDGANRVLVLWQAGRHDGARAVYALSDDGGETFGEPAQIIPDGDLALAQRRPAACMDGAGRALVVWQSNVVGREGVTASTLEADTFGQPRLVAPINTAEWQPRCGMLDDDQIAIVWSDFRQGSPRVLMSRRLWDLEAYAVPVAVDPSAPPADERLAGAQLMPAISPEGGHVVWLDYRDRSWDVYHARWDGAAFTPAQRIDGAGSDSERLHGEPRVVAHRDRVVVSFTDLHDRRAQSDIAWVTSNDGGATWSPHAVVPGGAEALGGLESGGAALSRFRPALAFAGGSSTGAVAVFQDLAPQKSALFAAFLGDAAFPKRIDDTGAAPNSLTHPSVARVTGGLLVVWEDDRSGEPRIHRAIVPIAPR
jgi:hypothetical protein